MSTPRFFIHVSAATVEDMIEASERHGAFVEARAYLRAYLPPSGRGVYGSVEISAEPETLVKQGEPRGDEVAGASVRPGQVPAPATGELQDPRDRIGCACPRIDGAGCIRARTAPPWDEDGDWTEEGEHCECACHEEYEADLEEACV